jgi:hypothetical protein
MRVICSPSGGWAATTRRTRRAGWDHCVVGDEYIPPVGWRPWAKRRCIVDRAAQHGLSARLSWPTGHRGQIRRHAAAKLVTELVPMARHGLLQARVAAAEADGLLEVISARAASGQTGAVWQRATLAAAKRRHDPQRALAVMLDRHIQCADTGMPVHDCHR